MPPLQPGQRMSEERLEIYEKQVHAAGDQRAIELCREIRRLQNGVASQAEARRRQER